MSRQTSARATAVGLSLLGAGIIHLAAVGTHRQAPVAVASFVGIGLAQMLVGGAWLTAATPRYLRFAAAAVTVPALLFWLASRTVGLPAWSGHHAGPEAVGLGDLIAVGLQIAAVVLAFVPARADRSVPTRPVGHLAVLLLAALLTVVGSFGTAAAGHQHDSSGHHGNSTAQHDVAPGKRSPVTTRGPAVSPPTPVAATRQPAVEPAESEAVEHSHDDSATPHGH